MSERTTQLSVASHRRFIVQTIVGALRAAFNQNYDRDRQLADLRISHTYPLEQIDYPTIVVEYENTTVMNAGVGHEEWFVDANEHMQKWNHSRFEGTMNFEILGLTPLDRDLLADALTEVIRFGRLDEQLLKFFTALYGDPNAPVGLIFNQIMFNSDEITSSGNTTGLAPWTPEDLMVYQTSLSSEVHGGYYNVVPNFPVEYITRVELVAYNPPDEPLELDFDVDWSNPFQFYDQAIVPGQGVVGSVSHVAHVQTAKGRVLKSETKTQSGVAHIA